MTLRETLLECLCAYEIFRRLGFKPEEILFVPSIIDPNTGEESVGMAVQAQGKQFTAALRHRPHGVFSGDAGFIREWEKLGAEYNAGKIADFPTTFELSQTRGRQVQILAAMTAKGFTFPATPAR